MSGLSYFSLDTESTGLSCDFHELIEFSVIRHNTMTQCTRVIRAENPRSASPEALKITGRTYADLNKGISKEEGAKILVDFLNSDGLSPAHRVIVAHNAAFDRRFVHAFCRKAGLSFPADLWLDSMKMARAYLKQKKMVKQSVKLDNCLKIAGLNLNQSTVHSASEDAQHLFAFWSKMKDQVDYLPMIETKPFIGGSSDDRTTCPEDHQEE